MKVTLAPFFVVFGALVVALSVAGCSSGLGNNLANDNEAAESNQGSSNRPVGLEVGVQPTNPIVQPRIAGAVVPAIGAFPERDVALVAFTTATDADDADGSGNPLSRGGETDSNDANDVFVAVVVAQDIDDNAFSQSLAGKFRHPRCATCHSMQVDGTTAFASAAANGRPHQGPLPGLSFPNNAPEQCEQCHVNSTAFPVPGWQAPATSFDLRTKTVAELVAAAQNVPADETEHFVTDPRVLWALDSGVLPTVGTGNGAADDDHDGIDEPSDTDGVIRTVPGGSETFIQQIEDWTNAGFPATCTDAVKDLVLVSRERNTTNSGNGASSDAAVLFVPNGSFSAPGTVGTLYVVYQSDASNLVTSDGNGATDVFRTAVDLVSDASGNLSLSVSGNATLVSATNGTTNEGDDDSTDPVIGGSNGELVAFASNAQNLVSGFTDANDEFYDIYVRNVDTNDTHLISHQVGNQATGGNGSCVTPVISSNGEVVAFSSEATDLINGDTNAVEDVFYADVTGSAPFTKVRASVAGDGSEGTGADSLFPTVWSDGAGRVLVAFMTNKNDLTTPATSTTHVFLYDSDLGGTVLLSQLLSSTLAEIGDEPSGYPSIGPDGANVAFWSEATNIDVLRADGNGHADLFLVDTAQAVTGTVLPYRFNLTTLEATDANGTSSAPELSGFATTSSTFGIGLAVYQTEATNLGTTDSTDTVIAFLNETSGVVPEFSVSSTSGVAPLTVTFTDESAGVPTAWAWDFDNDGNVDSTERNPTHTYTTAGTYTVKLVASNAVSSNEIVKTDLVRAIGVPTVDFSASTTAGEAPLTVTFSDNGTTEQPTSWSWDFGDGNSSTQAPPVTHTYTAVGTYTVALTATNEAGSTTETKADLIQAVTPIVAAFTVSPGNAGSVPFTVDFDASTSVGASTYAWDFGDGSSGTGVTTQHTFTSGGAFTVTLTATGPVSNTDTATTTINAAGSVAASFTLSASSAYTTSTLDLDASASTGAAPLTYEWDLDNDGDFDDATGVTVTGIDVGTQFPLPNATTEYQAYTIRLRVTGSGGGTGIASDTFTSVASSITADPIEPSKDTTIYSSFPDNCNPANVNIAAGRPYNGSTHGLRRALMEFDVAGNITSGSTILSAALQMTCTLAPDTNARTFSLYRVTTEWGEVGTDPGGTVGGGATGVGTVAAVTGDATWNSSMDPTAWTSAGGDFNASATRSRSITGTGVYTWSTNANMVSDVQAWMTPSNNHGWILRGPEGALTTPQARGFASREAATAGDRPQLTITYRPPLL